MGLLWGLTFCDIKCSLFFIFSPGERTICWFTKKQTVTKVNPVLSLLKFFWATTSSRDWLVYIESMPFTTSISVLEWPWNSMTPTLLNWRRARWHWHFCLGLVVELPFKTSSWVVIQRWLHTGAKSFHKDVITRSDFRYQRFPFFWFCLGRKILKWVFVGCTIPYTHTPMPVYIHTCINMLTQYITMCKMSC